MLDDIIYIKQTFRNELRKVEVNEDPFDTDNLFESLKRKFTENDICIILSCFDKAYNKRRK